MIPLPFVPRAPKISCKGWHPGCGVDRLRVDHEPRAPKQLAPRQNTLPDGRKEIHIDLPLRAPDGKVCGATGFTGWPFTRRTTLKVWASLAGRLVAERGHPRPWPA